MAGAHTGVAVVAVPAALLGALTWPGSWPLVLLAVTGAVVPAAAHVLGFWRGRARFPRTVVAVQTATGYLPAVLLGPSWLPVTGYLATSVLLTWRPRAAIPAAVLVCVVPGVLAGPPESASRFLTGIGAVGMTTLVALGLCGLVLCVRLLVTQDERRGELESRLVADERRRFARDLHDLLGLSLSAITLKGELVTRLVVAEPDRATAELAELLTMSRRALADVRAISTGYREQSLDDECRVAAAVLRAAGVEPSVNPPPAALPPRVALVLAAVLREGVTNVVRHSRATRCRCEIRVADDIATLEVVNDGVLAAVAPGDDCGAGLVNLRDRVSELGGRLEAGAHDDGCFRLRARIPLPEGRSVRAAGGLVTCGR